MASTVQRARSATIRDVAARAGVSTATVSRALGTGVDVGAETQLRVQDAARALRYRPSGVARSLKLRATSTIGLIVSDIENPYYPQVLRAVEDRARDRGYAVVLADGRRDPDRGIQSLELLAQRRVDGLLIASSTLTERHRDWISECPCPVVIVNGESPLPGVPAVLSDDVAGGRLAGEHLLGLGHRSITYVAEPIAGNVAVEHRLAGVRAALARYAPESADLRVVAGEGGVASGEQAARLALDDRPRTTGLICCNDLTAVGALRGLRSMGLRVPHDVSVVGFDDIELAPYVDPPLTTVRQATEDIGRRAVEWLIEAIDRGIRATTTHSGPGSSRIERVPVRLVVRRSTGPASTKPN